MWNPCMNNQNYWLIFIKSMGGHATYNFPEITLIVIHRTWSTVSIQNFTFILKINYIWSLITNRHKKFLAHFLQITFGFDTESQSKMFDDIHDIDFTIINFPSHFSVKVGLIFVSPLRFIPFWFFPWWLFPISWIKVKLNSKKNIFIYIYTEIKSLNYDISNVRMLSKMFNGVIF